MRALDQHCLHSLIDAEYLQRGVGLPRAEAQSKPNHLPLLLPWLRERLLADREKMLQVDSRRHAVDEEGEWVRSAVRLD